MDQLLVVTFGRAASQELRERVRAPARRARARARRDPAPPAERESDLLPSLIVARRRRAAARRRRGSAPPWPPFDSAAIATTHQFCHLVLTGPRRRRGHRAGATLVEGLDRPAGRGRGRPLPAGLRPYRRGAAESSTGPRFACPRARGRSTTRRPRLEPRDAGSSGQHTATARPSRFAECSSRRGRPAQAATRAAGASTTCSAGSVARWSTRTLLPALACAQRWSVVLVDEFQDTDRVQRAMLERAFAGARDAGPRRRSQAGDLPLPRRRRQAYLAAARTAAPHDARQNWRIDRGRACWAR